LQSAYIIRGLTRRAADDRLLTLPSQRAFTETVVRSYEAPEASAVEPDSYIAPQAPQPEHSVDERVTGVAPPEFGRFSRLDDDAPALPEPPPVIGTYEDDQGPPVQLPP
jgi:hypothetical protein